MQNRWRFCNPEENQRMDFPLASLAPIGRVAQQDRESGPER